MAGLKQSFVRGTIWSALERFGTRAVSFLVTLVLARLLTPADYGTVALITIFVSIASVIADSGFGSALVQKKDATELDFNSVFYLSLVWGLVIYSVLFALAPWIAEFYQTPELKSIVRVLGFSVVFNSVNSVQSAELHRNLLFHLSFRVGLVVAVVQGVVGIAMAFKGFGPWAIVWSQFAGNMTNVIMLWGVIAWRPRLMFSWNSVVRLFRFGWKLMASELINTTYNNLYGLIIGKLYSKEELAYVNKGQSVPFLAMDSINGTLGRVTFPVLAKLQDDADKLREAMRRILQCSAFVVFPLLTGCAVCAESVIRLLFGEKWLQSVPYVQLACFTFALWPIHTINLKAISARGRSDIYLMLEIAKKMVGLTIMVLTYRYGVWAMMATFAFVSGPICLALNMWPNRKYLGYTYGMMMRDLSSVIAACVMMAGFVWATGFVLEKAHYLIILSLQVLVGVVTYVGFAWMMRMRPMGELLSIVFARAGTRHAKLYQRLQDRFIG